jgi:hypothetical protein
VLVSPAAEHRRALVLLALCGRFWSTAGVLIKLVDGHPGAIWSARCAIAAALLYAIRRPTFANITRAEWGAAAALAAVKAGFVDEGVVASDAIAPRMVGRPELEAFERDRRDFLDPSTAVANARIKRRPRARSGRAAARFCPERSRSSSLRKLSRGTRTGRHSRQFHPPARGLGLARG